MIKNNNNKNKGFTLIEMVLAICVFAIAVTPILTTFITSAKINRNSRKMMAATDCAQAIIDSITDKSYEEVQKTISNLSVGVKTGYLYFSSLDANVFNVSSNIIPVDIDWDAQGLSVSSNEIVWDSTSYPTTNIDYMDAISASVNDIFIATCHLPYAFNCVAGTTLEYKDIQKLMVQATPQFTLMYYYNIDWDGYRFNAVVDILPAASDSSDTYYTYYVKVELYDFESNNSIGEYVNTINGGIRNKRM